MPTPQPPSRQILNNSENSQLDDFLNSFDNQQWALQDGAAQNNYSLDQFHALNAPMNMPPNFVGSESVMIEGNGHEVHDWQMDRFTFQNSMPHTDVHTNPALQHTAFGPLSHSGPGNTAMAPVYSSSYQQQPFQPMGQPLQTPGRGPVPNFGSDSHFQPSGFNHVPDQTNNSPLHDDLWLSSNPNTRPSTQPSSPIVNRKRKSEADHANQRHGFIPNPHGIPSPVHGGSRQPRVSYIKSEPVQEPTPHSSRENNSPASVVSDADAGAESDAEFPSQTTTPPTASTSKRPAAKSAESGSSKAKRKPSSGNGTKTPSKSASARPKAAQRNSSSQQSRRQPLSLNQKKANHTNSEQRRRDATARAQARLFDLVPNVRVASQKQSTVQKLTKVVEFVPDVEGMRTFLSTRTTLGGGKVPDTQSLIGDSVPDALDAAAAGALAGMGSMDGSSMFGDVNGGF